MGKVKENYYIRKEHEMEYELQAAEYKAKQVGGTHYSTLPIQPIDYIVKNDIPYREANVIKYVTRHKNKNGKEDILKAIHYLEMILKEYNA